MPAPQNARKYCALTGLQSNIREKLEPKLKASSKHPCAAFSQFCTLVTRQAVCHSCHLNFATRTEKKIHHTHTVTILLGPTRERVEHSPAHQAVPRWPFLFFCFPDTTYSLHFLFFLLAINLVFSLHGTAVPAATHRWERGKSVVFFLWSSMGCFCRYPKKFQSHSSLKSYTEYWLPPGWLPRRDVEFAGDCRRALLVGGCEDAEDDDEEDDAAGGG